MKVIGFSGSPHSEGNTATLVSKVLEGAASRGAETKMVHLNGQKIAGCRGCMQCRPSGVCILADDMKEIYREIREADAVVLGSPIYMFQMTSQTKSFVDRLYPFLNNDYSHRLGDGKKTVLVFTHNSSDPASFKPYFDMTANAMGMLGFPVVDVLVGAGLGAPGDALGRTDFLDEALSLGQRLGSEELPEKEISP